MFSSVPDLVCVITNRLQDDLPLFKPSCSIKPVSKITARRMGMYLARTVACNL